MINYGKQNLDSKDINEVIKVLKTGFITQGNKIREFDIQLYNKILLISRNKLLVDKIYVPLFVLVIAKASPAP